MIRSMTGYGRGGSGRGGIDTVVEMRSVNHRYFEFSARLPRGCAFLEDRLKSLVSASVARGKVDMFVTAELGAAVKTKIEINHELAGAYVEGVRGLAAAYALP